MRRVSFAHLAIATTLASCLVACRTVRPWERGALAHPTMSAEELRGPAEEHMRSVHEGATGGSGSAAGGGCGCN